MPNDEATEAAIGWALRVLAMVHELHKLGYQRIRILPGVAPSGLYWRCTVWAAPRTAVTPQGMKVRDEESRVARYTTGQETACFGWEDARDDSAAELAAKFVERFVTIAREGRGRDWAYAGWYVEMLGLAERGTLPIAYADWDLEDDPRWLPTTGGSAVRLPRPPAPVVGAGDGPPEEAG